MSKELNTHLLATMIKKKRGDQGLRAVAEAKGDAEDGGLLAEEIEVSAPTLSRIEQGKVPDVDTFLKVCRWLGEPPATFAIEAMPVTKRTVQESTRNIVIANLRADKELSQETINVLVDVIEMAYKFKPKK